MKSSKSLFPLLVLAALLIGIIAETSIGISIRRSKQRQANRYEYLYKDSTTIHFMDKQNFEEVNFKIK